MGNPKERKSMASEWPPGRPIRDGGGDRWETTTGSGNEEKGVPIGIALGQRTVPLKCGNRNQSGSDEKVPLRGVQCRRARKEAGGWGCERE